MGGHDNRDTSIAEAPKLPPQLGSEDGVQPHGGLVQHEQFRIGKKGERQRHSGLFSPGQGPHPLRRLRIQIDALDNGLDPVAVHTGHSCAVPEVLDDAEITVHRRRLCHVADTPPKFRLTCLQIQHLDRSAGYPLHPYQAPKHCCLAAATRTE